MTDRLTETREREIRARLERATPGPWEWLPSDTYSTLCVAGTNKPLLWYTWDDDGVHAEAGDRAFIAAAPADVRALLGEVERLRVALAEIVDPPPTLRKSAALQFCREVARGALEGKGLEGRP